MCKPLIQRAVIFVDLFHYIGVGLFTLLPLAVGSDAFSPIAQCLKERLGESLILFASKDYTISFFQEKTQIVFTNIK